MTERLILLVEDNASDIALTRRAFARTLQAKLAVAEDGQEALDYLFAQEAPLPDLILLDLNLPRLDGLTVLSRIRAHPRTRRVPVVILTSSVEPSDVAEGYGLGANSYIRKPVEFERFAQAVEQLGNYWLRLNQAPIGEVRA